MLLRGQLTQNWPKFLPVVVQSLNDRHIKSLGGVQPSSINSLVQDPIIREAQQDAGILPYQEPDYRTQNQNQENYESNKNNLFQVGTYVYLDNKATTFDKSFDTQISIFLLNITK